MKPLGEGTKAWAQRHLVDGPARAVAAPVWRALLAIESGLIALAGRAPGGETPGDVTAIIKTFERPRRCAALIASIRRFYPHLPIIVADDSRAPGKWPGTRVVALPFDSGVSRGRQAALELVETDFVLNLDDDFLFGGATRLGSAAAILRANPELDLLGGIVVDLPLFIRHDYRQAALHPTDRRSKRSAGTRIGRAEVMDKVANFWLARTAAVREIGWDPELKRLDHADFFTRAKGRLVTAEWAGWTVFHRRDPFDRVYRRFRDDVGADRVRLFDRYHRSALGEQGRSE